MGKISPLDGIGPEDIHLPKLQELVIRDNIQEVILALSPTIEGQTTIHFIQELLLPYALHISQLAHGIPSGGELEFLDSHTIGSAMRNRAKLHAEI
jgi:recombination protein RecR